MTVTKKGAAPGTGPRPTKPPPPKKGSYRFEYGIFDEAGNLHAVYDAKTYQDHISEGVPLFEGYHWRFRVIASGPWGSIIPALEGVNHEASCDGE